MAKKKNGKNGHHNENGQYCIGRIGFGGMRIAYRKGQKNYIEKMWRNYK